MAEPAWQIPLSVGQGVTPIIGTNPNALAQLQLNQMRVEQAKQEIAGQNKLKSMFANPNMIGAGGQFQPNAQAMSSLGQVDPNKALEVQEALATQQERQNRNALVVSKLNDEEQYRLLVAGKRADDEYQKVLKETGSEEQANRAAQPIFTQMIDGIKPTLRPETRGNLQTNFDHNRFTANAMANPLFRKEMMAETKEAREGYSLTDMKMADGNVVKVWTAPGKPPLNISGTPLPKDVVTGMAPVKNSEEPQLYDVKVPDGKGGSTTVIGRREAGGGFVNDETGEKLKGVIGAHKVSTKAEESPDAAGTPTGPIELHGPEYLERLPASRAAMIKGYAEGRVAFPGSFSLRSPYWQKMVADITQYDPDFDAVNYNARSRTRADFTSGKSAQNITSFNTAIGHLGTLEKAAEALNNKSIPAYNKVANFLASNTGDPRIVQFNTAKQAVSDELTRAFRGTGGNVYDIKGWEENLNAANSPEQLRGAVKQAVDLLRSRIEAVGQQYRRGMGTSADVMDLLTPAAKKTLASLPGGEDVAHGETPAQKPESSATPSLPTPDAGGVYSLPQGFDWKSLPPGAHFRMPGDPADKVRIHP